MNLILRRQQYRKDGIFGELTNEGILVAYTLEHAFLTPLVANPMADGGTFFPKTPAGSYTCVRGMHSLKHSIKPFSTFELQNVPGATGILFHIGNFNEDSEGCILLGSSVISNSGNGVQMLGGSKQAFDNFLKLQNGVDEFQLEIID